MKTKYYDSKKQHVKNIKIFLKKKKTEGEEGSRKDTNILLQKKKKQSVSIIMNVIKIFLRNKSKS